MLVCCRCYTTKSTDGAGWDQRESVRPAFDIQVLRVLLYISMLVRSRSGGQKRCKPACWLSYSPQVYLPAGPLAEATHASIMSALAWILYKATRSRSAAAKDTLQRGLRASSVEARSTSTRRGFFLGSYHCDIQLDWRFSPPNCRRYHAWKIRRSPVLPRTGLLHCSPSCSCLRVPQNFRRPAY